MDGDDASFILPDDKTWITEYDNKIQRGKRYEALHLRTSLIPQPFVGHPKAPIWILMLNPGYSSRDEHDCLVLQNQISRV